jgi:NAD(P)H-hydrate epimerase
VRYFNDAGVEVPAVNAEQMRELVRVAIGEVGIEWPQMIASAGRSAALLALDCLGEHWHGANVVVLAGGGGNAAAGICGARHLANRGIAVRLCLSEPEHLEEMAARQRRSFSFTAGREVEPEGLGSPRPDLILDALIGYGLRGAPQGRAADLIAWANASGVPVLSLDMPSGVNATTGHAPGVFVRPQWTLLLALPKTGLTRENCGELYLADLGIPPAAFQRAGLKYQSPFGALFFIRLLARDE